jgi:hypothetical protein
MSHRFVPFGHAGKRLEMTVLLYLYSSTVRTNRLAQSDRKVPSVRPARGDSSETDAWKHEASTKMRSVLFWGPAFFFRLMSELYAENENSDFLREKSQRRRCELWQICTSECRG